MKNRILLCFLLFGAPYLVSWAQSTKANTPSVPVLIAEGRTFLTLEKVQLAHAKFKQAVTTSPDHEEANALFGLTVVPSWLDSGAADEILASLGVKLEGGSIYDWSVEFLRDDSGRLITRSRLNVEALKSFLRDDLLPRLDESIDAFQKINSEPFLLKLSADETRIDDIDLDLGDVRILESVAKLFRASIFLIDSQDADVVVRDLFDLFSDPTPSAVEEFLDARTQLFSSVDDGSTATARAGISDAIDSYMIASRLIWARPEMTIRLFNLDSEDEDSEREFREMLSSFEPTSTAGKLFLVSSGSGVRIEIDPIAVFDYPFRDYIRSDGFWDSAYGHLFNSFRGSSQKMEEFV